MTARIVGLAVLLVVTVACADEYRTFTDTQGRTMEAKLLEVDPSRGRVHIECDDGRRVWVAPRIFSEKDQEYLRKWFNACEAISETSLEVSVELETKSVNNGKPLYDLGNRDDGMEGAQWAVPTQQISYNVILKNLSDMTVSGLRIEYRYFVDIVNKKNKVINRYQVPGLNEIESIRRNAQEMVRTTMNPLARHFKLGRRTSEEKDENGWYNSEVVEVNRGEDHLVGIWIRIYGLSVDECGPMREVSFPEDLKDVAEWDVSAPMNTRSAMIGPSTLEEIQLRGKAKSVEQFKGWMDQLFWKVNPREDVIAMRTQLEGLKVYYESGYDPDGYYAGQVAFNCSLASLYAEEAYWYEIFLQGDQVNKSPNWGNRIDKIYAELSILYSSCSDASIHDGAKAIKYANLLLDKDKKSDQYLELLARAYARNGQFDFAVKTQERAIKRLSKSRKDEADLAAYRNRLTLYQSGKAFTLEKDKNAK